MHFRQRYNDNILIQYQYTYYVYIWRSRCLQWPVHLNSINGLRAVHQIGPRYTSMGLCVEVVPGETERGLPEEQAEGEAVAVTWANARQV